jgi:protein SCO1/2
MKLRFFRVEFIVLLLLVGTPHRASAQSANVPAEHARANCVDTAYRGGLVNPPLPKPKFTLTDTSGVPFDFSVKTQGFVTLLFFGYTHCPDMCPTQMAMIGKALTKMPAKCRIS